MTARRSLLAIRAHNMLLLRALGECLGVLQAGGFETLLLKGASLLLGGYEDIGQRAMSDLDIAVRPHRFADALARLQDHGWSAAEPIGRIDPRMVHAVTLRNVRGVDLDLHCHPIYQSRRAGLDDLLWDAAESVAGPGWRSLRLCPEHQVLQLIAHGLRWADPPPIRWVADVVVSARRGPLCWPDLIAAATRLELTATAAPALAWLDQHGFLAVPPDVLAALRAVKVARREVRLRRILSTPVAGSWGAGLALGLARLDHLAGRRGAPGLLGLIIPYILARPARRRAGGPIALNGPP